MTILVINPLANSSTDLVSSLARLLHLFAVSIYHETLTALLAIFAKNRVIRDFLESSQSNIKYTGFSLSFKRLCVLFILALIYPSLMIWNHIGFALDNIFFPLWSLTTINNPAFIVGNARSGTTWLQRTLLSSDKAFTAFQTWEILFAVSITWKCVFYFAFRIDQIFFFGGGYKILQWLDHQLLCRSRFHPVSLFAAEEDEWLMMHIGLAQLLLFLFPAASDSFNPLVLYDCPRSFMDSTDLQQEIHELIFGSKNPSNSSTNQQSERKSELYQSEEPQLSLRFRLSIFHYYKQCVQRHLYFRTIVLNQGTQEAPLVFVSKNPPFTLRIETLYYVFPDAQVLCIVRDPVHSVPSMVSYIAKVWHLFATPTEAYPDIHLLLAFCKAHYLFPLLHLQYHNLRCGTPIKDQQRTYHPRVGSFVSYHHLRREVNKGIKQLMLRLLSPSSPLLNDEHEDVHSIDKRLQEHCPWVDLVRLDTILDAIQKETNGFMSDHSYEFRECCGGMTEQELQDSLDIIYQVHANLLK